VKLNNDDRGREEEQFESKKELQILSVDVEGEQLRKRGSTNEGGEVWGIGELGNSLLEQSELVLILRLLCVLPVDLINQQFQDLSFDHIRLVRQLKLGREEVRKQKGTT